MKPLYLIVDIGAVLMPLVFSFHPKLQFYRVWASFFPGAALVAGAFLIWDHRFTAAGVWGFNPRYTLGIHIGNLPVEEALFFFCIPYACVFTYYSLDRFHALSWTKLSENILCLGLAAALAGVGFLNLHRLYTSSSFLSTAALCLILRFILRSRVPGRSFTAFAVLFPAFVIVDGVLTGTGLPQPIVWYDNAQTLGIRLLSIPVEDFVYGFELLLLNFALFDWFRGRGARA